MGFILPLRVCECMCLCVYVCACVQFKESARGVAAHILLHVSEIKFSKDERACCLFCA